MWHSYSAVGSIFESPKIIREVLKDFMKGIVRNRIIVELFQEYQVMGEVKKIVLVTKPFIFWQQLRMSIENQ